MNLKHSGKASSIPAGLVYSTVFSVGITLIMTAVFGKMIDSEMLSWESAGYGIMFMLLISSFWGAVAACARVKRQRLLVCGMSGLAYFAVLLSITALFFGGQYEAVGVTAGLIAGGCGTAALLGMRQNRGGNTRKRKYSYR